MGKTKIREKHEKNNNKRKEWEKRNKKHKKSMWKNKFPEHNKI